MAKVITVFGASGNQGGSVARALAQDSQFKVRAVTRNPTNRNIQNLSGYGNVEIIRADANDRKSVETALQGAYGAFIVTTADFDDPKSVEKEIERGMTIANACKDHPTLKHIVFSTQLSPREVLGQEARQCDAKAVIDRNMRKMNLPMTAVEIPFNYERLFEDLRPDQVDMDNFRIYIPMGQVPMDCIAREDVGEIIRRVFTQTEKFVHKTLAISGDKLTVKRMAEEITRCLYGKRVFDRQMTHAEFRDLPFDGARDMANHFDFCARVDQRFNVLATRDVFPYVKTFSDWCREKRNILQRICS